MVLASLIWHPALMSVLVRREDSSWACPKCAIRSAEDGPCPGCGTRLEYRPGEQRTLLSWKGEPPPTRVFDALLDHGRSRKTIINNVRVRGRRNAVSVRVGMDDAMAADVAAVAAALRNALDSADLIIDQEVSLRLRHLVDELVEAKSSRVSGILHRIDQVLIGVAGNAVWQGIRQMIRPLLE